MDGLAQILTSNNLIPLAVIVVVLVILLAWLSRKGVFSFKGKGLSIGNDENERRIIRLQLEYIKSELDTYFEFMIKTHRDTPNFVELRCRLSKELVIDVMTEAVALNHITTDEFYVKGKSIKIWAELAKLDLSAQFQTSEFKDECEKEVEKIIKNLVAIRKYYSSHRV